MEDGREKGEGCEEGERIFKNFLRLATADARATGTTMRFYFGRSPSSWPPTLPCGDFSRALHRGSMCGNYFIVGCDGALNESKPEIIIINININHVL
eukprot:scaffold97677_cov29-Tisochrysis_lutea.AAC.4